MGNMELPKLGVEDIIKALDGVCNGNVDEAGSTRPLLECVTSVSYTHLTLPTKLEV